MLTWCSQLKLRHICFREVELIFVALCFAELEPLYELLRFIKDDSLLLLFLFGDAHLIMSVIISILELRTTHICWELTWLLPIVKLYWTDNFCLAVRVDISDVASELIVLIKCIHCVFHSFGIIEINHAIFGAWWPINSTANIYHISWGGDKLLAGILRALSLEVARVSRGEWLLEVRLELAIIHICLWD